MGNPFGETYKEKLKEKYEINTQRFDTEQQYQTEQDYFQMHMLALDEKKKTEFFLKKNDSGLMERVKENLNQINALFGVEIPADITEYNREIRTILGHYEALLRSSGEYISSRRGARSASGKARLEMVEKIRALAAREYAVFEDAAFQIFQENYGEQKEGEPVTAAPTWGTVLNSVRQLRVTLNDEEWKNTEEVGNGSSVVYKVKQPGMGTVYFKEREKLPVNDFKHVAWEYAQRNEGDKDIATMVNFIISNRLTVDTFRSVRDAYEIEKISNPEASTPQLREKTVERLKTMKEIHPVVKSGITSVFLREERFAKGMELIAQVMKQFTLADLGIRVAKMDKGSGISERNVASSRMAELLGSSDIIAPSRMMELTVNGKVMQGVAMREAEGIAMQNLVRMAKLEGKAVEYSAKAIRQLTTLQIIDLICGQIDRHNGNYYVTYEKRDDKYIVSKITGIDNDLAFGMLTGDDIAVGNRTTYGAISPLEDEKGDLMLPAVDAAVANRVMELKEEDIKYVLGEILTDREIAACLGRLRRIKHVLGKSTDRFLRADDEEGWLGLGEKFMRTVRERDARKEGMKKSRYSATYVNVQYFRNYKELQEKMKE